MTVIAWDGKTLAADKQATQHGLRVTCTKIRRIRGDLVAVCNSVDTGEALMQWYEGGAKKEDWPKCQENPERWSCMMVIKPDGKAWRYEQEPTPWLQEDSFFAIGSGRDFAIAAMYCGKTAKEAVAIACIYENGCGMGVDTLEIEA